MLSPISFRTFPNGRPLYSHLISYMLVKKFIIMFISKASLAGFASFALITIAILCTRSDNWMFARAVLIWPGVILQKVLGLNDRDIGVGRSVVAYIAIVNGILGAL